MKLTFVHKTDRKIHLFDSLAKIKEKIEDADEGFYYYVRALELNQNFNDCVNVFRKRYSIPPQGYAYEEIENIEIDKTTSDEILSMRLCWHLNDKYLSSLIPTILTCIPYIVFFNRIPVMEKTHLKWHPELYKSGDDEYKEYRHLIKKEHRYIQPKDFWELLRNNMINYVPTQDSNKAIIKIN